GAKGLHSWAVQPGGVLSNLIQHIPEDQAEAMNQDPGLAKIYKTPEQGASTSVWAAVSKDLEGKGGKYLDDCQIMGPVPEGGNWYANGYGSWAYDEEKEGKMWKKSLELVDWKMICDFLF